MAKRRILEDRNAFVAKSLFKDVESTEKRDLIPGLVTALKVPKDNPGDTV
jgi:hypothetical protein